MLLRFPNVEGMTHLPYGVKSTTRPKVHMSSVLTHGISSSLLPLSMRE